MYCFLLHKMFHQQSSTHQSIYFITVHSFTLFSLMCPSFSVSVGLGHHCTLGWMGLYWCLIYRAPCKICLSFLSPTRKPNHRVPRGHRQWGQRDRDNLHLHGQQTRRYHQMDERRQRATGWVKSHCEHTNKPAFYQVCFCGALSFDALCIKKWYFSLKHFTIALISISNKHYYIYIMLSYTTVTTVQLTLLTNH